MNEAADHQVIQAIFPAVELFDAAIARGETPYQLQALSPASHQRYSHARSLYGKTSKAARQSATRQAPHTAKAQHKQHRVTTDAVVIQREASLKLSQAVRNVRIHHVLPIQAVDDAAAVHHVAKLQSTSRSSSPEHIHSSASIQHQLQQHRVPCWPTRQEGVKAPQPKRLGGSINSRTDLVGAQACIALHADDARRAASAHQSQPHHHHQRQQHIRLFNSDGADGACSPELVSSSAASVDSSNDAGRGAAALEFAQTDTAEELNDESVAEPLFHLITQAGRCDDYTQPMVMVRQQSASQQHKAVSSTAASQEQEVMVACPKWASQLRMSFAVQLLELTSSAAGYSSVPRLPQQQQCAPPECSSSEQLCVNHYSSEEYKQEQECRNLLVALKGLELASGRLHEASGAEQQTEPPSDLTHVHSRPRSRIVTTAGSTRNRMTLSAVGRQLSPALGCSIESQSENTFAAVAEAASAARQVSSREQGGLLQLPRPASAADFRQRWMRSELFDPFGVLQSHRVQASNRSQQCDRVSTTEVADDVAACATAVAGRIQPRTGVTCLLQIPPTKQQSISALQESMARSQVAVGRKCPAWDVSLQCKLSSEGDACRGCSSAPGCRRRAQSRFTTKQERNHGRCDCRGDAAGIEWCSSKQGRRNKQASSEGGAAGGHRWVVSACTSDTGFAGGFYDEETATMYVS